MSIAIKCSNDNMHGHALLELMLWKLAARLSVNSFNKTFETLHLMNTSTFIKMSSMFSNCRMQFNWSFRLFNNWQQFFQFSAFILSKSSQKIFIFILNYASIHQNLRNNRGDYFVFLLKVIFILWYSFYGPLIVIYEIEFEYNSALKMHIEHILSKKICFFIN